MRKVFNNVEDAIKDADVVMGLRSAGWSRRGKAKRKRGFILCFCKWVGRNILNFSEWQQRSQ